MVQSKVRIEPADCRPGSSKEKSEDTFYKTVLERFILETFQNPEWPLLIVLFLVLIIIICFHCSICAVKTSSIIFVHFYCIHGHCLIDWSFLVKSWTTVYTVQNGNRNMIMLRHCCMITRSQTVWHYKPITLTWFVTAVLWRNPFYF